MSGALGTGDLAVTVELDTAGPAAALTAQLNAACDEAEQRSEHTVLVMRLASTAVRREWPGAVAVSAVNRWERALRRLERLPAMSIAVARGTCTGAALDLLVTADFRIAARDLHICPPINDGRFWPGMIVYRLVQHLGVARARQMVLWGDDLTADQATALGLLDQISDDLDTATRTATVLMGRISDPELAVRRRLLAEAPSVSYEEALGSHLAACDRELRLLAGGAAT